MGLFPGLLAVLKLVLGHWLGDMPGICLKCDLLSISKPRIADIGQDQLPTELGTGQKWLGPGFFCDKIVPLSCGQRLAWNRTRGK